MRFIVYAIYLRIVYMLSFHEVCYICYRSKSWKWYRNVMSKFLLYKQEWKTVVASVNNHAWDSCYMTYKDKEHNEHRLAYSLIDSTFRLSCLIILKWFGRFRQSKLASVSSILYQFLARYWSLIPVSNTTCNREGFHASHLCGILSRISMHDAYWYMLFIQNKCYLILMHVTSDIDSRWRFVMLSISNAFDKRLM